MLAKSVKYNAGIVILYALFVLFYTQSAGGQSNYFLSFVMAGLLAFVNIYATLFFLENILKKPHKEFVKLYKGSTLIRIFFLVAIFFTIMLNMPVNHFVFSVAFFILYFLFHAIQIFLLHSYKHSGEH